MKAELRLEAHELLDGEMVCEVFYNGAFIAAVYGADGPGVRVVSKQPMVTSHEAGPAFYMVDVQVGR